MFNVISKPADQIAIDDIQALIEMDVPEGDQIEFKESLRRRASSPDPWILGEDQVGEGARDAILEEAIAFANAHGGALLIGIRESNSNPPVAAEITPVPRCVELAERFKLKFRDCVEPNIPSIEVFGVPTDGDSGVVIVRIGRSRLAPHRVTRTRNCTIRRADRCESMTMREIQDMTLNISRGLERFEKRLAERSERFRRELNRLQTPDDSYGLRLTALPVGEEIRFDRVCNQQGILDELYTPWCRVISRRPGGDRELVNRPDLPPLYRRPVLRGARVESDRSPYKQQSLNYQELHCDGMVELGFAACNHTSILDPDLPLVLFANTVVWTNHVRSRSFAPMAEYGLEVEIHVMGDSVRIGKQHERVVRAIDPAATSDGGLTRMDIVVPEGLSAKFPLYSLNGEETPTSLLSRFKQDFWSWLGEYVHSDTEEFVISH
ncbi:MAG: ATP-binding protein [Gemmatimonadota bacterium]|nr:ATP-binding protein [Gemmatimonadota bacterium]